MTVKILGIIPARFASTRLPGKLLIPIQGKTLLQRTYENALRASIIDRLLIATDDSRIFNHAKQFSAETVMTSINCPNGTDRLAEVLQKYPEFMEAEAIVNIQGDEPCVDPLAIEEAVKLLIQDPLAKMATIITPLKDEEEANNPSVVKCVKDQENNALYFSRSLIPSSKHRTFNRHASYFRHIGLYVYRPSFLLHYHTLEQTPLQLEEDLEQLKVLEHGHRIKVAITDKPGMGVDTPEDLIKIEKWICKQNTFL
ncbi:MAG: 3-deoxy-manno-octulosonate cytidylyltransferase [Parachlamydiaceae bacterium]